MENVPQVENKNASLGETIGNLSAAHVSVPDGFAFTASAYYDSLSSNSLCPIIQYHLNRLDTITLENLGNVGEQCRKVIQESELHEAL